MSEPKDQVSKYTPEPTMNKDELNRGCAEALGWKCQFDHIRDHKRMYYEIPKEAHIAIMYQSHSYMLSAELDKMHFHDSYDWAMLMVKKAHEVRPYFTVNMMLNGKIKEPSVICEECLEVLRDN